MPPIADDTRLPADIDAEPLVRAAAALRVVLRGYREELERDQRLGQALVEQLHAAGFYSLVIPRELGGLEVAPLTYLRVVELLAEGAGSVGWNVANNQLVTLERGSRLAECWRDLQVVGQTVTLAPEWYPIGGRIYLGMDPGPRLR